MTRHISIAIAALLSLVLTTPSRARDIANTMNVGGFQRSYTVFVPDDLQKERGSLPAVIVLHGGLGTGSVIRKQMHMDAIAVREGFVTVYPDGLGFGWNDGRADRARQRGPFGRADDVVFLRSMVDTLIRDGLAARSQIFLTGVSNGGMMTLRMGCEAADLFAGIAPIVANIPAAIVPLCKPSRAVPLLLVNATEDPLVPWSGGGVGFLGGRGQVISTAATIDFWRQVNGCSAEGEDAALTPAASRNGTQVDAKAFNHCRSGAPVVLVSIKGGGHRIPGREDRTHPVIDWFLGPQNHDFETAEEVWRFFASQAFR